MVRRSDACSLGTRPHPPNPSLDRREPDRVDPGGRERGHLAVAAVAHAQGEDAAGGVAGGEERSLTPLKILQVARGGWHIVNTGLHPWTTRRRFDHVFVHNANTLLTLFLYHQVRCYDRDRGKSMAGGRAARPLGTPAPVDQCGSAGPWGGR
jgi:hypothetical protein